MSVDAASRSHKVARVNDVIRELSPAGSCDPIPFLCECGVDGCGQSVWLTADEYDEARSSSSRVIVIPAHAPLEVTRVDHAHRYAVIDLTYF